jgi:hypothetical protein
MNLENIESLGSMATIHWILFIGAVISMILIISGLILEDKKALITALNIMLFEVLAVILLKIRVVEIINTIRS